MANCWPGERPATSCPGTRNCCTRQPMQSNGPGRRSGRTMPKDTACRSTTLQPPPAPRPGQDKPTHPSSEERRVGKECLSTCRSRSAPELLKNKHTLTNYHIKTLNFQTNHN